MLEKMTLDEAIALFDRQGNANKEREHDRRQIAEWLRELKERRNSEIKIALTLAGAEMKHPYRVVGDFDTYCDYNQGWSDAVDFIGSSLGIDY